MAQILAIDDDPDIGMALVDLLAQEGYTVTVVETGHAALELSRHHHFQVVLLDLGLPDCDGLDVLSDLRYRDPTLPIIILTAYSPLERHHDPVKQNQAFAYLSKPFDRKKLKDTIRRAIHMHAHPV